MALRWAKAVIGSVFAKRNRHGTCQAEALSPARCLCARPCVDCSPVNHRRLQATASPRVESPNLFVPLRPGAPATAAVRCRPPLLHSSCYFILTAFLIAILDN